MLSELCCVFQLEIVYRHSISVVMYFSIRLMEHFVSGMSGGTVSTLILHPLDLIKLRFAGKFCWSLLSDIISTQLWLSP